MREGEREREKALGNLEREKNEAGGTCCTPLRCKHGQTSSSMKPEISRCRLQRQPFPFLSQVSVVPGVFVGDFDRLLRGRHHATLMWQRRQRDFVLAIGRRYRPKQCCLPSPDFGFRTVSPSSEMSPGLQEGFLSNH